MSTSHVVEVWEDDFDLGIPNSGASCPIANALNKIITNEDYYAWVDGESLWARKGKYEHFYSGIPNPQTGDIWLGKIDAETYSMFVSQFDEYGHDTDLWQHWHESFPCVSLEFEVDAETNKLLFN